MRALFALAALPLLATFAPFALFEEAVVPERPALSFAPVQLEPGRPSRRELGGLTYLGGWELDSDDPRFGGISAMHVEDGRVTAISDAGSLIRFALPGSRPPGLSVGPLPAGPGEADNKLDRDAEAMAVHGRLAWITFERRNVVWRYAREDWRGISSAAPRAMRYWAATIGSEAMLRLPDGRFLIFAEGGRRPDGSTEMLLFDGDPALVGTKATSLRYRAPEGYRITDATMLPDGRMLFLNRQFVLWEGFSAKLTLGELPALNAGTVLTGREIARFERPLTVDNLEALSITRENGRTIVWIASDDNFLALQRTLLLKFALRDGAARP